MRRKDRKVLRAERQERQNTANEGVADRLKEDVLLRDVAKLPPSAELDLLYIGTANYACAGVACSSFADRVRAKVFRPDTEVRENGGNGRRLVGALQSLGEAVVGVVSREELARGVERIQKEVETKNKEERQKGLERIAVKAPRLSAPMTILIGLLVDEEDGDAVANASEMLVEDRSAVADAAHEIPAKDEEAKRKDGISRAINEESESKGFEQFNRQFSLANLGALSKEAQRVDKNSPCSCPCPPAAPSRIAACRT